jgi:magnesium chelatase family protein
VADRFDLRVEVPRADAHGSPGECSEAVADRVAAARARIDAGRPPLDSGAEALLADAVERLALSARGRDRVQRVAGTIAALGGREHAVQDDVAEALAYRLELTR